VSYLLRAVLASYVFLQLWIGLATSPIDAQDLLGMPTPRDPSQPGSVVLHGGGMITDDVFDRFVELAGGKHARIVFVPCAGFRREEYSSDGTFFAAVSSRYGSWSALVREGRAASFQFLYTDNPEDANNVAFCKPLETATGVWFSGGWQSRLHYRFVGEHPQQTRFQKLLKGVLERGGVAGGTSAGTAALPEVMTMWDERQYATAPATAVPAHGLGLLTKCIVEQHFDARGGRLERFTGLLRDSAQLDQLTGRRGAGEQMLGLAVEERTALIARGNQLQVLGTGTAHIF
jgi:cyanophycinase